MHDHLNGGRHPWPAPSPLDILLRIEGRLGGLETGQRMTIDAVKEGFRKSDHAHGRITALTGRVESLERSASMTPLAGTGQRPTERRGASLRGLTAFLRALAGVLAPVCQLAGLAMVGMLAVKGAISPADSTAWLKSLTTAARSPE